MLVFPDSKAYREAIHATTRSSAQEYREWVEKLGILTQQSRMLEIRQQVETTCNSYADEEALLSNQDRKYIVMQDSTPMLTMFGQAAPYLVNYDGRLKIGDGLHEFTREHHILVTDEKLATLERAKIDRITNYSTGVIYEPLVYSNQNKFGQSAASEKVQQGNLFCINSHLDRTTVDRNGRSVSGFALEDEQRFDGNRERMQSAWIRQVQTLSGSAQSRTYDIVWSSTMGLVTQRKRWIGWRSIYPKVRIGYEKDNGSRPGSTIDPLIISRWATAFIDQNGTIVRDNLTEDEANAPLLETFLTEHDNIPITVTSDGSAGRIVVIDDFSALFEVLVPGTIVETRFQHIQHDGTISARWTNRGDDVDNDPISVEYNCR